MLIIIRTWLLCAGNDWSWKSLLTGFCTGFAFFYALCSPYNVNAQQQLLIELDGKPYRANISWVVKHNNINYNSKTEHNFDWNLDHSIDLAVFFNFANDSLPPDTDVVWGFQFSPTGGILSPAANEKRSRSRSLFQRFEVARAGNATVIITPRAWRKTTSGKFESFAQGKSFSLSFSLTDGNRPVAGQNASVDTPAIKNTQPVATTPKPQPRETPLTTELRTEESAYAEAKSVPDTIRKIKALMDFVDKYDAPHKPQSKLVAEAIRNVPLGISVPEVRGDGTYAYTLNYASKPFVDSSQVRGWQWQLLEAHPGKYQLVLTDLRDTVHAFKLADSGKNAPFNELKELRPFDRIRLRFLGESSDSFRIRAAGGAPPFIVFLAQNGFPKERYIMDQTDTTWSFSKSACVQCRTGTYSLEIYTSDFSTLLLKEDNIIHIRRINYLLIALGILVAIPIVYFGSRHFRRFWQIFNYERKLRAIQKWEIRETREAEKRKTN